MDESAEVGEEVAVVMFRAVRELLFNVAKHSGEKHAWLKMLITPAGMVEVEVRDGGVGFDPGGSAVGNGFTGGFGLFNIRERLTGLGGGMELSSAPGDGCRAILRAPLHAVKGGTDASGRMQPGRWPQAGNPMAGALCPRLELAGASGWWWRMITRWCAMGWCMPSCRNRILKWSGRLWTGRRPWTWRAATVRISS